MNANIFSQMKDDSSSDDNSSNDGKKAAAPLKVDKSGNQQESAKNEQSAVGSQRGGKISEEHKTEKSLDLRNQSSIPFSGSSNTNSILRGRQRDDSPPMIKEYNPLEANAKVRAAQRREELRKRREQSAKGYEASAADETLKAPKDPRPWKGYPSSFFALQSYKRGTHKYLTDEQKNFLLIYYPDSVMDPMTLLTVLGNQAKEDEEKQRARESEVVVSKKKRGRERRQQPTAIFQRLPTGDETKPIKRPTNNGPSFEDLLADKNYETDFANAHLTNIRAKIAEVQKKANAQIEEATRLGRVESQARSQAAQSVATAATHVCSHCAGCSGAPPSHLGAASVALMSTSAEEDERARQNLLRQIAEAKKRQARMEAEEARRLHEEARRLAETANVLELEAQRPLFEARRLEKEAIALEHGWNGMPEHLDQYQSRIDAIVGRQPINYPDPLAPPRYNNFTGPASTQPQRQNRQGDSLNELYGDGRRDPFAPPKLTINYENMGKKKEPMTRKEQLLEDARETQQQILMLKRQAQALEAQHLVPTKAGDPAYVKSLEPGLQALYKALENPKPRLVVSSNSLAARKAVEEKKLEEERKAAAEKAKAEAELQKYEKLILQKRKEAQKKAAAEKAAAERAQPRLQAMNRRQPSPPSASSSGTPSSSSDKSSSSESEEESESDVFDLLNKKGKKEEEEKKAAPAKAEPKKPLLVNTDYVPSAAGKTGKKVTQKEESKSKPARKESADSSDASNSEKDSANTPQGSIAPTEKRSDQSKEPAEKASSEVGAKRRKIDEDSQQQIDTKVSKKNADDSDSSGSSSSSDQRKPVKKDKEDRRIDREMKELEAKMEEEERLREARRNPKKKEKSMKRKTSESPPPEDSEEIDDKDPAIQKINKELRKARKAFEKVQLKQEAAKLKRDTEVKKQKEEIERAAQEANEYFERKRLEAEGVVGNEQSAPETKKRAPRAVQGTRKLNAAMRDAAAGVKENKQTGKTYFTTYEEELQEGFENFMERLANDKKRLQERYKGKDFVWEFLGPVLSGKILRDFAAAGRDNDYAQFKDYVVEENFYDGHAEYFHKWRYLFLFETYNFLMNSRWSKFQGSETELKAQLMALKNDRALCWKGYFQFKGEQGRLCMLKMFKQPPGIAHKKKNFSKIYPEDKDRTEGANFELSHVREDDLLVLSKFRINLEGQTDIKMVSGGQKFLKEVLSKPGVIFAYVHRVAGKLDNFCEVVVDGKFGQYFQGVNDEQSTGTYDGAGRAGVNQACIFTRYCYYFEGLTTALREFKALKSLEFTRLAPILTYPTLSLTMRDKMIAKHAHVVSSAFASLEEGPNMYPKVFAEDEEKQQLQMNNYLIQNHPKFNQSQAQVLEQVVEMPNDELLLIQGPPGTGKTHTIIGIVSMIMSSRLDNPKQKIMICAPSNAAVDQIMLRILDKGLIGLAGLKRPRAMRNRQQRKEKNIDEGAESSDEYYDPPDLLTSLIRINSADYQTESQIKKYTLEQRIIKRLSIEKFGDLKKAIKELKELIAQMGDYDAWEQYPEFPYVNKVKFKNYIKKVRESYLKRQEGFGDVNVTRQQQQSLMDAQLKTHERELQDFKNATHMQQGNQEWKDAEKSIIKDANIICCTLSMAGSNKLDPFINQVEFLIVDEACQSTEPSTLIPFRLQPKKVILVGDQQQLPATTFSGNSETTGYCRSLFERLLDAGYEKTMLTIQFRMHPKIRAFPSERFYDGEITDHKSIGYRAAPQTILNLARVVHNRMIFFDIDESEEQYENKSKCNLEEADFTKLLVEFIARKMSLQGTLKYIQGQIGVISPYKAQVRQLYNRLEKLCVDQTCSIHETLEVNTVDAFQGSEKDIIIFNCVRSNAESYIEKSLGFLLDERRLNVAITRPKYFLFIVGNSKTLRKSDCWDSLIDYCVAQGKYVGVSDRSQFETMAHFRQFVVPQLSDDYPS